MTVAAGKEALLNFIGGEWTRSKTSDYADVHNPATAEGYRGGASERQRRGGRGGPGGGKSVRGLAHDARDRPHPAAFQAQKLT